MANAEQLLGPAKTQDYVPRSYYLRGWHPGQRKPRFTNYYVDWMVMDPRITYGLWMLKGPILSNVSVNVESDNLQVTEFVKTQVDRFWESSAFTALSALDWGYSGSEALYLLKDNKVQFNKLKPLHARDVKLITIAGEKAGIIVKGVPGKPNNGGVTLGGAKGFWHVHAPHIHPYYGISRLFGAYDPWYEDWSQGGLKDSIRLYYFKYAMRGDVIRFPPSTSRIGGTPGDPNAETELVDHGEYARSLVRNLENGATLAMPSTRDENGNFLWELEALPNPRNGTDLLEGQAVLDRKKLEGMGIPAEMADKTDTGSWAARRVVQEAYFQILQQIVNDLVTSLDEQIIRVLVNTNFGPVNYKIEVLPLLSESEQNSPAVPTASPPSDSTVQGDAVARQQSKSSASQTNTPGSPQ